MTDYRALAADLIRFACLSRDPGRPFEDPVYKAVTEGRQDKTAGYIRAWEQKPAETRGTRPFYSSCGDLAHWLLFRLGVRFRWINRDEHDGWHYVGADNNVTTLCRKPLGTNPVAIKPKLDEHFQAGDILIVGTALPNTTHVTCVINHDPRTGYLLTGDYGQPHGALRDKNPLTVSRDRLWRGNRSVDSWLPLLDVIEAARSQNLLQEPESYEEYSKRFTSIVTKSNPGASEAPTDPAFPAVQPTLRRGSHGPAVKDWQRVLGPPVVADGDFGPRTELATKAWQMARGLTADGVVGPKTWAASDEAEDTQPETPEAKS